jgi:hypothetical protein
MKEIVQRLIVMKMLKYQYTFLIKKKIKNLAMEVIK